MAIATTATSLASSFLGAQELSNGVKSMGVSSLELTWTTSPTSPTIQPYAKAFCLQCFCECKLIHGRWAMLATRGALAMEAFTGITWQDAGKVELVEGSTYFGLPLPLSISTLVWIETLVIGYIKFQRNGELDPKKHLYPGGIFFDPLGIASNPEKKEVLKLAKIKHARLAMVGAFGFAVRVAATCRGPMDNWAIHLSDPLHTTIIVTFTKLEGLSMHLSNFWSGLALENGILLENYHMSKYEIEHSSTLCLASKSRRVQEPQRGAKE
ncbi:hypothetical protein L7F22_036518 [Adiantum nelumboides]|nr:hypothetical protein [Adiantum nelumboides]